MGETECYCGFWLYEFPLLFLVGTICVPEKVAKALGLKIKAGSEDIITLGGISSNRILLLSILMYFQTDMNVQNTLMSHLYILEYSRK
jgi:hypothetical protein